MKFAKYVILGILGATITSSAFAQTKIYITGSTAFRAVTVNGIGAILSGTVSIAYDGLTPGVTSATNANAVTWTGGTISGQAVTIKASWSGSATGIQSVAGAPNFDVRFLPDGASGGNNQDPRQPGNPAESAVPDTCMTDVFQSATLFHGPFQGVTYANLTDNLVGVVTFVFAASRNFPIGSGSGTSSSYSMTRQLAQALYPTAVIPLSTITGMAADANTAVFATGRDPDSGERLTAMSETNVGVRTLIEQCRPTTIVGATITHLTLYPSSGGEPSGSVLAGYLNDTLNQSAVNDIDSSYTNGGYLMTYLGVGDYNSVSANAVKMKYAGNDFSQLAVEEGRYTFWGYEHLDYKPTLFGIRLTFVTTLRDHIRSETSGTLDPNVALSDMLVQRFADGDVVTSLIH